MISEQEKSLDKFKELYYSCSNQEKLLCLESELSNQTLLYRLVIKPGAHWLPCPWFLEITFMWICIVCVCVCVHPQGHK